MRPTEKLLNLISRRTSWTEGHVFAIVPEQIGFAEGLRAGVAIGAMLAACLLCDIPTLAWSAVAAFWVCLCDPMGGRRSRLRVLLTFTGFGTAVMMLSSYGAHWGPVAAGATLFILVLLCGLTRSYQPTFGPVPPQMGLISSIAVVIGVSSPRGPAAVLELGGCFLFGAIWATLLCVFIWPVRSDRPARRALAAIFSRLEDITLSLEDLDASADRNDEKWVQYDTVYRRAARISIERGRQIVARASTDRTRFGHGIDAAGQVLAALIALGHFRRTRQQFDADAERPLLKELRRLLRLAQDSYRDSPMLREGAGGLLQAVDGRRGTFARAMKFAAGSLMALAQRAPEPSPVEHDGEEEGARRPFRLAKPVWRHALRVSIAVLVSYCFGLWFDVTFSYWGSIATLVVMQPLTANTWLRVLERAAGSLAGGAVAAILIALVSSPTQIALLVVPLSVACIALRLVSYGIFVLFLTPMFMLLSDFIHPAGGLISARVINEAIGATLGLVASLSLWPEPQRNTLVDSMSAAIAANLAFAVAALRGERDGESHIDQLHRDAGIASSRAETARERLVLEGQSRVARLDSLQAVVIALRAICAAVIILDIGREAPQGRDDARADRYDAISGLLQQALHGLPSEALQRPASDDDDLGRAVRGLIVAVTDYSAGA